MRVVRVILGLGMLLSISQSSAEVLNNKTELAKLAQKLSNSAIKHKEWTKAKILLMNAYNRQPERLSYLSALYEFHRQYEQQSPQATAELIELMERAQYLIAPQHINIIQQYILALKQQSERFQSSALNPQDLNDRVNTLIQITFSTSDAVHTQINKTLNQVNNMLNHYSEGLNEEQKSNLYLQQHRLSRYLRLLDLSAELKRYVSLLKKTNQHASPRAKARMLMISNTLNIMYGEDLESLPNGVKLQVNRELDSAENALQQYRKESADIHYKSAIKLYNVFIEKYNQAVDQHEGFQQVFTEGSNTVEALRGLQLKMQDPNIQLKARELTRQAQTYVNYALEAQRVMYNRWAAKRCLQARTLLDDEVSLSDDEAVSIFDKSSLAAIDVRYISPEVNSIYHQLIQEILAELPAKKAIQLQRQLMLSEKHRLEVF